MIQYVADGVVSASIIALGAIGLSMTYNILRFANFAQGEILTVGAYLTLLCVHLLGFGVGAMGPIAFGGPLLFSMVIAALATGAIVLLVDALVFGPLRNRRASRITLIMAAFGLSLMGRNLTTLIAGGEPAYYDFYIPKTIEWMDGVRMRPDDLAIIAVSGIAFILLQGFLTRTSLGRQMRAVSESPVLSQTVGIDVRRVIRTTWMIGATLATAAGVLLAHNTQLRPEMGFDMLLPMFGALILGGATSLWGTLLGALVIGLTEALAVAVGLAGYRAGVVFLVILAFLILRPHGLIGRAE